MKSECVFCEIVAGRSPASKVFETEEVMAFMTLRPTRPGECLVIPKQHVDHFIDLPPQLLSHVTEAARVIGGALQREFEPLRVGLVVHGFGVPHAHFILVPQHGVHDITSGRFASVAEGEVRFDHRSVPECPRDELDRNAVRIRNALEGEAE